MKTFEQLPVGSFFRFNEENAITQWKKVNKRAARQLKLGRGYSSQPIVVPPAKGVCDYE
jgi:hypothetical protein